MTSPRHLPSAFLALFASLFAFNVPVTLVHACSNPVGTQLWFEHCNKTSDCAQLQGFLLPPSCRRRNDFDILVDCNSTASPDNCMCRPVNSHYCSSSEECLDEHYCAKSARSENHLCVGCTTLTSPGINTNFIPLNASDARARCYDEGRQHPPCGHAQDLCSVTMPCDPDYDCAEVLPDGRLFDCAYESTRCQCIKRKGLEMKLTPCANDDDCESEEMCANYTTKGETFCLSCHFMNNSHEVKPRDPSSTRCNDVLQRPVPSRYVEGPNGRSFSRCRLDAHCGGNRRCMKEDQVSFNETVTVPCNNEAVNLCYCLEPKKRRKCKTGSDCLRGESCLTISKSPQKFLNMFKSCTSNALLDVLSDDRYRIIGDRTPSGDGKGLNDDECKFDWNCKHPRRCTHEKDVFGQCSGRRGCRCKPLMRPACEGDSECEKGEKCVTTVDAVADPFCMSAKALEMDPFIFAMDDPEVMNKVAPTPIPSGMSDGLTEDACLNTTDCMGERLCYQRFDIPDLSWRGETRCDGSVRDCVCKFEGGNPNNCTTSADCDDFGEVCIGIVDEAPVHRLCESAMAFDQLKLKRNVTKEEFGPRPTATPEPSPDSYDDDEDAQSTIPTATIPPDSSPGTGDSPSPMITPEPETPPCVDAKLLHAFESHELVFSKHIRAGVLCDMMGSCATPGHMVTFDNEAMSMKTFCNMHARCERRTRWVNSPRMRVGVRVESYTAGLAMTALAARYETAVEERVLRQLIHLGV